MIPARKVCHAPQPREPRFDGFSVLPGYRRTAMLSRPTKGRSGERLQAWVPESSSHEAQDASLPAVHGGRVAGNSVDLGCKQSLTPFWLLSRNPVAWKEQASREWTGSEPSPGEAGGSWRCRRPACVKKAAAFRGTCGPDHWSLASTQGLRAADMGQQAAGPPPRTYRPSCTLSGVSMFDHRGLRVPCLIW